MRWPEALARGPPPGLRLGRPLIFCPGPSPPPEPALAARASRALPARWPPPQSLGRPRRPRAGGAELGELGLSLAPAAHRLRTLPVPALEMIVRAPLSTRAREPDLSDHDDTTMTALPVTTARVLLESMSSSADSDDESLPELVEPGRRRLGGDARRAVDERRAAGGERRGGDGERGAGSAGGVRERFVWPRQGICRSSFRRARADACGSVGAGA